MIFVYFLIAILSILIDQLTKLWLYGKSFSLISDFLWIESSFNQGAAGGIVYSHTLCVRVPFQIATVSPRFTCKTCFFVGPWGPYRPLLTKIKTGINPV